MVRVVTDSVSDIPLKVAEELGITIVPLHVRFGAETYRDGVDLSTEEFYQKLTTSHILPTTTSPSPGEFSQTYDELAEETDEILSIHVSSKLTGVHEAALQGKNRMKQKCRVEVIDSLSAVMGEGFVTMAAAKEAKKGANLEQVTKIAKEAIPKTHLRMCFDTLEYLRRGGRIGRARALLGSALKVNPIIGLKNGEVYPFDKKRTRSKAIEALYNFTKSFTNIRELAVEHATTPEEVETLVQRLNTVFPMERIYITTVAPVIGAHVGPRVIGVTILEG